MKDEIEEMWDRHYSDRQKGLWDQARQDRFRLLLELKMLDAELVTRRAYMQVIAEAERTDK